MKPALALRAATPYPRGARTYKGVARKASRCRAPEPVPSLAPNLERSGTLVRRRGTSLCGMGDGSVTSTLAPLALCFLLGYLVGYRWGSASATSRWLWRERPRTRTPL